MMHLSVAVLEAIKNKAYSLRPLEQMPYSKRHGIKKRPGHGRDRSQEDGHGVQRGGGEC